MSDHENSDDDDDMADLFSFSTATPVKQDEMDAAVAESFSASQNDLVVINGGGQDDNVDDIDEKDKSTNQQETDIDEDDTYLFGPKPTTSNRIRTSTTDSVLNLLEEEDEPHTSSDLNVVEQQPTSPTDAAIVQSNDTQEILDWLDKDKNNDEKKKKKDAPLEDPPDSKKEPEPTIAQLPKPDPPAKKPDPPEYGTPFETLEDAIRSPNSTISQIRRLFVQEEFKVDSNIRASLWCRSVCGKTLEQVLESSIADSFVEWNECHESSSNQQKSAWIEKESSILAERIVAVMADVEHGKTTVTEEEAQKELSSLLQFHYQSKRSDNSEELELDPLLPPVACALLSAGIPTAAASVMLSNIVPTFMPLLALANKERLEAAKSLHTQFYLLACYHLPLLVHHLDRYAPGWHWPKVDSGTKHESGNATVTNRNLEAQGVVPQSWLISHLAGECGGTMMNPKWLVSLWDLILTSSNNSLRFFFSLALLEKHSDNLLMMTGETLLAELARIMEFKEGTTLEGFAIEPEEDSCEQEAVDWVQEWCARARTLWESTPRSIVSQLRTAEDDAVAMALQRRQQVQQEALEARLEAEAKAHAEAVELEKEKRMEEARAKLTRARLVAYYRKHNPEKEDTVDKILKTFDGRLEVLDAKLKKKYGVGFNPALKPKPLSKKNNKILSTMNQSISVTRQRMAAALQKRKDSLAYELPEHHHEVTCTVSPTEVLPILCWSKEGASRGMNSFARRQNPDGSPRIPMKFYLVDSRPTDTCQEQGRFPTAVNICPETLLDPDRMLEHEEMFESLRGAVHICVMGEGFSAVPTLYGQKLNSRLQELTKEDDSRTSLCALFFVKKGFPFVSILDGGFAAAHAWLAREGPKRFLSPSSALVDYDENVSLFAQLESAYREQEELANATTRERTQHAMQNLLIGSLASLTRNQIRLENLASELETQKVRQSVSNIFARKQQEAEDDESKTAANEDKETADEAESLRFHNPFASLGKSRTVSVKKKDEEDATSKEEPSSEDAKEPNEGNEESTAAARFRNPFAKKVEPDESNQQGNTDSSSMNPLAKLKHVASSTTSEEGSKDSERESAASKKNRRFPGFGSALNNMTVSAGAKAPASPQTKPAMLKRNPFAMFGAKAAVAANESSDDGGKVNRFASLNQFRMRVQGGKPEENAPATTEPSEESISFFDNDDSGVDGETTPPPSAAEGGTSNA